MRGRPGVEVLHHIAHNGPDVGILCTDATGLLLSEFDVAGTLKGKAVRLVSGRDVIDARAVHTGNGWPVTWTQYDSDGRPEVRAIRTDGLTDPSQPSQRISRPTTATLSTLNGGLIRVNGTTLAAMEEWTTRGSLEWVGGPSVTWAPPPNGSRESVIVLVRLDDAGAPIGPPRRLLVGVPSVENVQPMLEAIGDDVALAWLTGSVIYACAGCITNTLHIRDAVGHARHGHKHL